MDQPECGESKAEAARNKLNQGQDEKIHTFVNPANGETREATMLEFRHDLRYDGFVKQEDAADTDDATSEVPA